MIMYCVHLSTFASRESDSRITNVCQSVIKTPKHLRIMPIKHGCIFFRKPRQGGGWKLKDLNEET